MNIKTLTVMMLLIAVLGTMLAMPATAATATRTLPDDCVEPGAEFTVIITAEDYGSVGAVTETLCDGWEYVSVTGDVDAVQIEDNDVKFLLLGSGPRTFTYTVLAPDTDGTCCQISGTLRDYDKQDHTIAGDTEVCVRDDIGPDEPTATRTIPDDCVSAGAEFTVTITAEDYGSLGAVTETLCSGWEYVSVTGDVDDVKIEGNSVKFLLLGSGPRTFTYTVLAPDTDGVCCQISGTLRDNDAQDHTVTGATEVCVYGVEPTATRTIQDECIAGAEFTVTITADNYGSVGAVTETLCSGWEYVSVTGDVDDVKIEGNSVKFMLLGSGPRTFTYTVLAPDEDGCCQISGTLRDEDTQDHAVTGATEVCVGGLEPIATRTLPDGCVSAGAEFTVTITAEDYGSLGAVTETLCTGWEYVSVTGAVDAVQIEGNNIKFLLMGSGPRTFTYTVLAPDTDGVCCQIIGTLRDEDTQDYTVTGATEVCVCDVEPIATRTLPDYCVSAGTEFTVTITVDNYGSTGAVMETICDGWTYQSTKADDVVLIDANMITFPLMESGPCTFTYTVLAPNDYDSCCTIGGILRDEASATHGITGDCAVCTCGIGDWWDEWMGLDSEGGSAVTTTELQAAIHYWLEDLPVRGHVMSTQDLQWIISEWLSG